MPWNPSEHNRVGELLGRGITDAGTSIADAITDAKQKHDELKGWKTLADALSKDPANGIDPASVDKMTLSQAKMLPLVAETRRAQVRLVVRADAAATGFDGRAYAGARAYCQSAHDAATTDDRAGQPGHS